MRIFFSQKMIPNDVSTSREVTGDYFQEVVIISKLVQGAEAEFGAQRVLDPPSAEGARW